jgi:hypothetical protein
MLSALVDEEAARDALSFECRWIPSATFPAASEELLSSTATIFPQQVLLFFHLKNV